MLKAEANAIILSTESKTVWQKAASVVVWLVQHYDQNGPL